MQKDYYSILGLDRKAGPNDIKKGYRQKALKYHPDNYKGEKKEGEKKFKEVSTAYEVLSNPNTKNQYDRFGSVPNGRNFVNARTSPYVNPYPRPIRGKNKFASVSLTLEEVCSKELITKEISVNTKVVCGTCNGTRVEEGKTTDTCVKCRGRGKLQFQEFPGIMGMVHCNHCMGSGKVIKNEDKCKTCFGSGSVNEASTKKIKIPRGIRNGNTINIKGQGDPGQHSGPNGDLNVQVHVLKHDIYQRRINDLYMLYPISFSKSVLGGFIKIPTIYGNIIEIKIKPNIKNLDEVVLKNLGCPDVKDNKRIGDLKIVLNIVSPDETTSDYVELMKQLSEIEDDLDFREKNDINKYLDNIKQNRSKV
jgi:molecular chaperone DnaJ